MALLAYGNKNQPLVGDSTAGSFVGEQWVLREEAFAAETGGDVDSCTIGCVAEEALVGGRGRQGAEFGAPGAEFDVSRGGEGVEAGGELLPAAVPAGV